MEHFQPLFLGCFPSSQYPPCWTGGLDQLHHQKHSSNGSNDWKSIGHRDRGQDGHWTGAGWWYWYDPWESEYWKPGDTWEKTPDRVPKQLGGLVGLVGLVGLGSKGWFDVGFTISLTSPFPIQQRWRWFRAWSVSWVASSWNLLSWVRHKP